jgi:putative restriction endonuclease
MASGFEEAAARVAVFGWLEVLSSRYADSIPRAELERGCPFPNATGSVIRVIGPQGIFKPRDFELPLSITTSPESPYGDSISGR